MFQADYSPAPLSFTRVVGSDPAIISKYFDLLECTLMDNGRHDKPSQIFNLDEMSIPLDPCPPRVVNQRGMKNPLVVGSGDKSQIAILSCCSAAGYALPPLVILDRLQLTPELTKGEVLGSVDGLSKKGWIDGSLLRHGSLVTFWLMLRLSAHYYS